MAAVAKNLKFDDALSISTLRDTCRGLPVSFVSARASASISRSMRSAMRERIRNRSSPELDFQLGAACQAERTAISTSNASDIGINEMISPVAGLVLSI